MTWRALIPDLIRQGRYRTQSDLVRALSERGLRVDQAAVSRELRVLGVTKLDGVYCLPSLTPEHPVHKLVTTANDCLVVVVTAPALAMALAQQIDRATLDGVLGTVAGDDTVFVATDGRAASQRLADWLRVPLNS